MNYAITSFERKHLDRIVKAHELSLQHEILLLACWSRCRTFFWNDDDVALLVMQLLALLVCRYLGPRDFKIHVSDTFLRRTYFRIPDAPYIRDPTASQVTMTLFLKVLHGRIR